MNGHDRTCPVGEIFPEPRCVEVHSGGIGFGENRNKTVVRHRKHRRYIRIRWNNHLVAAFHHSELYIGAENQAQGVKTVGDTDAAVGSAALREFILKRIHFRTSDITAARGNAQQSLVDFFGERAVDRLQVEKCISSGIHSFSAVSFLNS